MRWIRLAALPIRIRGVRAIDADVVNPAAGLPVVIIVNRGPTRGDPLATVMVDAGTSETLTDLAAMLPPPA